MSKMRIVEVMCDACNCAIGHYLPGHVDQSVRDDGGIVSRDGQHFCDNECRTLWRSTHIDRGSEDE